MTLEFYADNTSPGAQMMNEAAPWLWIGLSLIASLFLVYYGVRVIIWDQQERNRIAQELHDRHSPEKPQQPDAETHQRLMRALKMK